MKQTIATLLLVASSVATLACDPSTNPFCTSTSPDINRNAAMYIAMCGGGTVETGTISSHTAKARLIGR